MSDPTESGPAKPRVLKTRLALAKQGVASAAESIGIAENTLRGLLRDDWDQLSRDTIEKVCDRYGLKIGDFFEFADTPFWDPLLESNGYAMVRGGTDRVQPLDAAARSDVTRYLSSAFRSVKGTNVDHLTEPDAIIDFARENNTIVVGSARKNRATEVVVCRHFNATPFSDDPSEKAKIPFRFSFSEEHQIVSTMTEPWRKTKGGSGVGIYDHKARRHLIEVNWRPYDEYMKATIEDGRDAAMVLVVNKPFDATKNVKLIVLAGLTGIGTQAAANALVSHYRDLEPQPGKKFVLGILEAQYKKIKPDSDDRVLLPGLTRWKYLDGGRKTVLPPLKRKHRGD